MNPLRSLQGAAAPDTVILARDVYDLVQAVATVAIAAALLVIIILLAQTLVELRRTFRAIEGAGQSLRADPGVESLRKVAGHAESISDRLTHVSGVIEERIEDYNALMDVVQREAEGTFVDGAAVARGVRAGLDKLRARSANARSGDDSGGADEEGRGG